MAAAVVGRDEELGALGAFLDGRGGTTTGLLALALEGEAGIGKSTLWRAAVEDAAARGLRVLSTRPAEAERALAYAALGDLLDGVLDDVLPALTPPRRRALEVALLVEDAAGRPVDARALGVAVHGALELLAEDGLVVAIDDLQWLDASSASALAFAVRRLVDNRVTLLWTRRLGERIEGPGFEEALDPERVVHLPVGPLSLGATHRMLLDLHGRPLTRPTVLRVHQASGGNPLYALELARALRDGEGSHDPTRPLPVPERLDELLSARLAGYEGATRDALVLASAHARLTPAQLAAAGVDPEALGPALDGNVVELRRGVVRFTHPLLASVLYVGLTPPERRGAHRVLADVVEDPLARARHLALSADVPDRALAAALEEAAATAGSLGAAPLAAELAEHAARLTPAADDVERDRRAAAAARAHYATGEVERARVLADELLARVSPGQRRAEALALRADVADEGIADAIALQREALREPGVAPELCAALHRQLSLNVRFREGLDVAEEHAQASVQLAEQVDDDGLRAAALSALAFIRLNAGKEGALALAERAADLAAVDGQRPETDFTLAHVLVWSGELDRARQHLERIYVHWSERDEYHAAYALWYLAITELRAGRLELADGYAAESRALAAAYSRPGSESPTSYFPSVLIAAHRGDLTRARELADAIADRAELHDTKLAAPFAVRGMIELWSGDAAAAIPHFDRADRVPHPADVSEPNMGWWRMDQVEALLELGRIEDAVERLDQWEASARRLGRAWSLAHARRCRGLEAAARGDVEEALELLEEAVRAHEAIADEFGRARALLALGVTRRRTRQKRAAREAVDQAAAAFASIGAEGWAERARAELGRIGGRTRADGLTPAEQRVADLVAAGRTNAEVAAALFLAERTVASHLTHVYAKLGVRSRTELSRKLASRVPTP